VVFGRAFPQRRGVVLRPTTTPSPHPRSASSGSFGILRGGPRRDCAERRSLVSRARPHFVKRRSLVPATRATTTDTRRRSRGMRSIYAPPLSPARMRKTTGTVTNDVSRASAARGRSRLGFGGEGATEEERRHEAPVALREQPRRGRFGRTLSKLSEVRCRNVSDTRSARYHRFARTGRATNKRSAGFRRGRGRGGRFAGRTALVGSLRRPSRAPRYPRTVRSKSFVRSGCVIRLARRRAWHVMELCRRARRWVWIPISLDGSGSASRI
jgi:hypothetical protein